MTERGAGRRKEQGMVDWKRVERRKVTMKYLMKLAGGLTSEDGENREYNRALAELLTDAAGLSMDFKGEVARRAGIKDNVE